MIRIEFDGQTINGGDRFFDRRADNVRTLEVTGMASYGRVQLTVISVRYRGEVTATDRRTVMTPERLLSSAFERVTAEAEEAAR